jgi:hypothetical protein
MRVNLIFFIFYFLFLFVSCENKPNEKNKILCPKYKSNKTMELVDYEGYAIVIFDEKFRNDAGNIITLYPIKNPKDTLKPKIENYCFDAKAFVIPIPENWATEFKIGIGRKMEYRDYTCGFFDKGSKIFVVNISFKNLEYLQLYSHNDNPKCLLENYTKNKTTIFQELKILK